MVISIYKLGIAATAVSTLMIGAFGVAFNMNGYAIIGAMCIPTFVLLLIIIAVQMERYHQDVPRAIVLPVAIPIDRKTKTCRPKQIPEPRPGKVIWPASYGLLSFIPAAKAGSPTSSGMSWETRQIIWNPSADPRPFCWADRPPIWDDAR